MDRFFPAQSLKFPFDPAPMLIPADWFQGRGDATAAGAFGSPAGVGVASLSGRVCRIGTATASDNGRDRDSAFLRQARWRRRGRWSRGFLESAHWPHRQGHGGGDCPGGELVGEHMEMPS